jgi:hypothetical protein
VASFVQRGSINDDDQVVPLPPRSRCTLVVATVAAARAVAAADDAVLLDDGLGRQLFLRGG